MTVLWSQWHAAAFQASFSVHAQCTSTASVGCDYFAAALPLLFSENPVQKMMPANCEAHLDGLVLDSACLLRHPGLSALLLTRRPQLQKNNTVMVCLALLIRVWLRAYQGGMLVHPLPRSSKGQPVAA